jgi:uncharacterized protein (DUF58 family)
VRAAACGIALLLCAAGLVRAEGAFFAAAFPFAAFAALGLLLPAPEPVLEGSRTLSSRFAPSGTAIEVRVRIVNRGPRLPCVALADAVPEALRVTGGDSAWAGSLDAGAEVELRYTVEGARGCHAFTAVAAEAEDPFTAVKARRAIPCPASLAVYPRAMAVPALAFGAGAARPFSGRSRAKRTGTGTDFSGTRDYAPGDPLRCLNWRAEALWGHPVVNVFEEERAIDTGIILDCRCEAYDREALFEAAAAAALSMAEDLLDHGHRVAFLSYGSLIAWTPSGTGREHRLRLRQAAARAELGAHAAFDRFDNLPVRIFPPRSLVLVVSPLLREDVAPLRSLRALGYAVAVLRPDPLADGEESGTLARRLLAFEHEVLQSRLLRSGIALLDWKPSGSTPGAAHERRGLRLPVHPAPVPGAQRPVPPARAAHGRARPADLPGTDGVLRGRDPARHGPALRRPGPLAPAPGLAPGPRGRRRRLAGGHAEAELRRGRKSINTKFTKGHQEKQESPSWCPLVFFSW